VALKQLVRSSLRVSMWGSLIASRAQGTKPNAQRQVSPHRRGGIVLNHGLCLRPSSPGVGYRTNNLFRAEAAHAGLAYRVTPSVTLELAHSYFDLGSARAGASTPFDATTWPSSTGLKSITSNDLTLGALWSMEQPRLSAPQPVTKG